MRPALLLLALGGGCTRMAIDGQVLDVTGSPIQGAVITVLGTPCRGSSDAEGRFEITCQPGTYDLSIGAMGYISETVQGFEAGGRQRYDLGKRVLIRVPDQQGLLRFDGQSYAPMTPGRLEWRRGGSGMGAYKHYCLPREGTPANRMSPGLQAFFDNESEGWRPWRLDDEGCAYRMSPKSPTQWGVDYQQKAEFEAREVAPGKDIVLMKLEPGRYFIADWRKGFFTKAPGDEGGFSGYYIEVGD